MEKVDANLNNAENQNPNPNQQSVVDAPKIMIGGKPPIGMIKGRKVQEESKTILFDL